MEQGELRHNGVLRSSLPADYPRERAKSSLICTNKKSLICGMRLSLSIATLDTNALVKSVPAKKRRKLMSQDVVEPKGPAPQAVVNTARKHMKYLETLLTTGTEEVINAAGTSKRMTTVRRSVRK